MTDNMPQEMSSQTQAPADRSVWVLGTAVFVVIVLILTVLLYIIAAGVLSPPAPRTSAERQLFMLEQIVEDKPDSVLAWADYINASTSAGQYRQAETLINQAENTVGSGLPEIELSRAKWLLAQGRDDEGLDQLEATIEITEEYRASELERLTAQGIAISPQQIKAEVLAEAGYLRALVLVERELWSEAKGAFDSVLVEQPTNADALVARGHVSIELGDEAAARSDFDQALVYIPDYQPALDGLDELGGGSDQ